jgi:apolipoprotein D and lipocalin family protein
MIANALLAVRNACCRGPTSDLSPATVAPTTVAKVDLERYLGTWFEVARLPNPEEDGFGRRCVDVTATYSKRRNGTVDVLNVARNALAGMRQTSVHGWARAVDASGSKLVVTFFYLFGGDYWVLGLDPDYRWALVGTPRRRRLWLLSRTPVLAPAEYDRAMAIAAEQGYDPARIVRTPQSAAA